MNRLFFWIVSSSFAFFSILFLNSSSPTRRSSLSHPDLYACNISIICIFKELAGRILSFPPANHYRRYSIFSRNLYLCCSPCCYCLYNLCLKFIVKCSSYSHVDETSLSLTYCLISYFIYLLFSIQCVQGSGFTPKVQFLTA